MSKIYYNDKEFENLLHSLGNLIEQIEKIDDPSTKEMIYNILQHFDAVHREALHRLWKHISNNHSDLRELALKDYTIKHLMALYDLEAFVGIQSAKDSRVFISEDQVTKL